MLSVLPRLQSELMKGLLKSLFMSHFGRLNFSLYVELLLVWSVVLDAVSGSQQPVVTQH